MDFLVTIVLICFSFRLNTVDLLINIASFLVVNACKHRYFTLMFILKNAHLYLFDHLLLQNLRFAVVIFYFQGVLFTFVFNPTDSLFWLFYFKILTLLNSVLYFPFYAFAFHLNNYNIASCLKLSLKPLMSNL